jgi:tRNA pseudouridine55 synthase
MTGSNRHGLLLLNKMPGVTSFDSLATVKKAFATGKVGHTGTLDKFADGLLLVLVGRGVKLIPLFENCIKEYTAAVFFGEETDTLDPEGAVIAKAEVPSRQAVEDILDNFRGDILQTPPAYSAKHINGRRSYELAREGKTPEMKKLPVTIHELVLLSWTPPIGQIRVRVSSGTYIRSLARDIALAAGSRARLSALKRNMVGPFRLEDAVDLRSIDFKSTEKGDVNIEEALRPINTSLFEELSLPYLFIDF